MSNWINDIGGAASGAWKTMGPLGQLGIVGGLLDSSGIFKRKRKDNEMEAMKGTELSDFSQQQGLGGLIGTYGREDYRRGTEGLDRATSGYMDALMNPAVYDTARAKFAADRARMMDSVTNRVGTMGGAGQAARVAAQMTANDATTAANTGQIFGNQQNAKAGAYSFLANQSGARRQFGLNNMMQGGNLQSRANQNLINGMRWRKNYSMQQAAQQGKFMSGLGSTLGSFAGMKFGLGNNGTGTGTS